MREREMCSGMQSMRNTNSKHLDGRMERITSLKSYGEQPKRFEEGKGEVNEMPITDWNRCSKSESSQ